MHLRAQMHLVMLCSLILCTAALQAEEPTYDQDSIRQEIVNFFGESTEGLAKVLERARVFS